MIHKPTKISLTIDKPRYASSSGIPTGNQFPDGRTQFQPIQNPLRNTVTDYCRLQGVSHPADMIGQIPRTLDTRLISLENSSCRHFGIGISTSMVTPPILFYVQPLETKYLGVNPIGEADQWIHIMNPSNGEPVGDPQIINRITTAYVIRDGVSKVWIGEYGRVGFKAAS